MSMFNWGPTTNKKDEKITLPIIGSDYVNPIKQGLSVGPRIGLDPNIWTESPTPKPSPFAPTLPDPTMIPTPKATGPVPFNNSEIRQHTPSLLDKVQSWNIKDALLSGVPHSIFGGAISKATDKIGEATMRANESKFPYGIPTKTPEYVPQNMAEKVAQFAGANLADAPIWALNPGELPAKFLTKPLANTAPRAAKITERALGDALTGGALGFAQGKIEGESNKDALIQAGVGGLFGAGMGAGIGALSALRKAPIPEAIIPENPSMPKPGVKRYSESSYWRKPSEITPEPQNTPSQPRNINLNRTITPPQIEGPNMPLNYKGRTFPQSVEPPAPEIPVYRGFSSGATGKDSNLSRMRDIMDVINEGRGVESKPKYNPVNMEYYTESPEVARSYADQDKGIVNSIMKTTHKSHDEALETFRTLYGRDPIEAGTVKQFSINPRKVLDLSDLGENPDYRDVINKLLETEGSPIPEFVKGENVNDPKWQRFNEIEKLLIAGKTHDEEDIFPIYRLLRNMTDKDSSATQFVDWLKKNGYDSIKYAENGTKHYAITDSVKAREGKVIESEPPKVETPKPPINFSQPQAPRMPKLDMPIQYGGRTFPEPPTPKPVEAAPPQPKIEAPKVEIPKSEIKKGHSFTQKGGPTTYQKLYKRPLNELSEPELNELKGYLESDIANYPEADEFDPRTYDQKEKLNAVNGRLTGQSPRIKEGIPPEVIDRIARKKGAGFDKNAIVHDGAVLKNYGEAGDVEDLANLYDTVEVIPPKEFTSEDISVGDNVFIPIRNKTQKGTDGIIKAINGDKAAISFNGTKPVNVPIKDIKWNHSRDEIAQKGLKDHEARQKAERAENDKLNEQPISLEEAKNAWNHRKNTDGDKEKYKTWEIVNGKVRAKGEADHEVVEFYRSNGGKTIEWRYVLPERLINQEFPNAPKLERPPGQSSHERELEVEKLIRQIKQTGKKLKMDKKAIDKTVKEITDAWDMMDEESAVEVAQFKLEQMQKPKLPEPKPEGAKKGPTVEDYQRTIDALKADLEERLQKDIEVMKGSTGKGKENGQIFFDEYGDFAAKQPFISNNPPWYAELQKKPQSEKAWRELALKQIREGYNGVSGRVGPDKEFIQIENDIAELEKLQREMNPSLAMEEIRKAQDEMAATKTDEPDIERLSYPDTVANAEDTPEVFRKALTENETEFLYEVKHNKDTIEKAADLLSKDYDSTLSRIYDPKESLSVEEVAAGQILIKRALDKQNYDTAKALTTALAQKAKTDGQKIQILAAYGRTTPEGILKFAEKEIEDARTPKQTKRIEDTVNDIDRKLGDANKTAIDTVSREIEDDLSGILNRIDEEPKLPTPTPGTKVGTGSNGPSLPKPTGKEAGAGSKTQKPKKELTPEEMLARRVASTLADPKKKDDPIRDMVNILFKVAQESPLPDNRLPKNPLELVVKAIKNRGQYRDIWNKAKAIVEEKFADNPEALDALEAYFEKGIKRTFPQKELNKAVDQGLKALAKDVKIRSTIAQVVREHYIVGSAMRTELVNRLVKQAGLKDEDAKILEKYVRNRVKELTKQKKESILAGMFKERITPKNRTIIDKIIEMSNLGGFQHDKYKDLVAAKLGFPHLSEEGLKSLHAQAQKIQTMKPGEEKSRAIAKMLTTIAEEIPPTLGQKVATIQTMAQLLNPKTAIRNLVGNIGLSTAENAADFIGSGIDKLISLKTKKRTMSLPSLRTQIKGGVVGAKDQARDIKEGINTFAQGTKHDLPRMKTFRSGPLSKLEDAMNYELRVPDRAFYEGARQDSLRQQMKLAKVNKPTPEMEAIAEQDALYRTLQDENTLSRAFVGLKKTLNFGRSFGIGDFVIKYPKTPANILNRGIDFSPAGFIKLTIKTFSPNVESLTQREVVKSLSRAIVGTLGLTGVGAAWHSLGIMSGSPDKHGDVATLERQVGLGEYKINVSALNRFRNSLTSYLKTGKMNYDPKPQKGDNLVSYDWFQPNAIPLVIGADIDANKGSATGAIGTLISIMSSSINAFSDQPVMQGVEQLFRYGNVSQGIAKTLQGVPASFWPTLLNQVRQISDNQKRSTYDPSWAKQAGKMVQNKIPFAESVLPKVYDTFGKPDQTYKQGALGTNNPLNVMVNPAFVTKYNPTSEEAKALDVYRKTGNTGVIPNTPEKSITSKGKKYQLTPEEYSRFQRLIGEGNSSGYAKVRDSLSAEARAKLMEKYLSDSRSKATKEILKGKK